MRHDFVWDVQTQLHGKERRICPGSESPKLEEICDSANVSSCSIRGFVDYRIDICREGLDEPLPSRFARDFDRTKPESGTTNVVQLNKELGRRIGRIGGILSSNRPEFRLALWTFHVRISENIQHQVSVGAGRVSVGIVGVLVVDEKENHEVARDSQTI